MNEYVNLNASRQRKKSAVSTKLDFERFESQ